MVSDQSVVLQYVFRWLRDWLSHHLEVSVLRLLFLQVLSTISHLSPELAKGSPSVESGGGVWGGEGRLRLSVAWSLGSRYL